MIFNSEPDLRGLSVALQVEEAGQWYLWNPEVHRAPPMAVVQDLYEEISSFDAPHKMPDDARYLRLLVDAGAYLHGERTRAIGWQILGLKSNEGRARLTSDPFWIPWSLWVAAQGFGFGHISYRSPDEYFGRS